MSDQRTTSTDPDAIKEQIESTRGDLSDNVNALADTVRPSAVAHRQARRVREGLSDVKDTVMGSSHGPSGASGASNLRQAVSDAPARAARTARGNPVAAGVIAFGAGWLLSSLLPASEPEKRLAATVQEKAEPLAQTAKDAAKDVADDLRGPAQDAVSGLQDSAKESAATVKEEATQGGGEVASSAKDAADTVRDRQG